MPRHASHSLSKDGRQCAAARKGGWCANLTYDLVPQTTSTWEDWKPLELLALLKYSASSLTSVRYFRRRCPSTTTPGSQQDASRSARSDEQQQQPAQPSATPAATAAATPAVACTDGECKCLRTCSRAARPCRTRASRLAARRSSLPPEVARTRA